MANSQQEKQKRFYGKRLLYGSLNKYNNQINYTVLIREEAFLGYHYQNIKKNWTFIILKSCI